MSGRATAVGVALLWLSAVAPAWPQSAPPAAEPAAPRRENPGLINELGKLLRNPPTLAPWPALNQPDAGAADGGLQLRPSSMISGRERCPAAANGASDCKAAAVALCRSKGFADGSSLDTEATQSCSAEALLLSGRKSAPGACRTNYFVTRAMCQ